MMACVHASRRQRSKLLLAHLKTRTSGFNQPKFAVKEAANAGALPARRLKHLMEIKTD